MYPRYFFQFVVNFLTLCRPPFQENVTMATFGLRISD